MTNRTFNTAATYTIPATGGIWLNNANYTVAATASGGTTSNNGLFRVTQGTYNIGIGAGDQMRGGTGAVFTIEGGTINVSGAFDPQSAVTYTQSAGTLNVGVVGNNVSALRHVRALQHQHRRRFQHERRHDQRHQPQHGRDQGRLPEQRADRTTRTSRAARS